MYIDKFVVCLWRKYICYKMSTKSNDTEITDNTIIIQNIHTYGML